MNKNYLFYVLCLSNILFFSSCLRPLYKAEAVYDPMLTAKGQGAIGGGVHWALQSHANTSFDINGAYSPIEHLSFKASLRARTRLNINTTSNSQNNTEDLTKDNGLSFEGGIGYYTNISERSAFSVYANVHTGYNQYETFRTNPKGTELYLENDLFGFSVQPSMVYKRKNLNMSTGFRLGLHQFNNIFILSSPDNEYRKYLNVTNKFYPIFEPFYTIEIGKGMIKFNANIGLTIYSKDLDIDISSSEAIFPKIGFGINVKFPNKK